MVVALPEEIWLSILTFIPSHDLWTRARLVNNQFSRLAEHLACKDIMPHMVVRLVYTLGSGSTHRWYDVWATVALSFSHINETNSQYALFALRTVHPEKYRGRALEKWRRMCAAGFGTAVSWRIALHEAATGAEVGVEGKLPRVVAAVEDGIWVDWRELLEVFCEQSKAEARSSARYRASSSLVV